jgi:hypothetical protein
MQATDYLFMAAGYCLYSELRNTVTLIPICHTRAELVET